MTDSKNGTLSAHGSHGPHLPADYEYTALMSMLHVSVSKHLLDDHYTVVWANEFYYEIFGWPKEEYEATFHNQCDLYYVNEPEEWEKLGNIVKEALASHRKGYSYISRLPRKNGDYVWVRMTATFSDEYIDGKQVAYTVMMDVSDLVRMQTEQSVTYENLPGFVAKYRIEKGFEITLLDANERFRAFFGGDLEKGNSGSVHRENIQRNFDVLLEHREELLAGKSTQFLMCVHDINGNVLWLQVSATCIDWKGGCPVYLAIFIDITDVTELRKMQRKLTEQTEALKEALDAAEYANRAKSDFLSRMSHDIRTPMNAIMGMTAIAASHLDNPERVADCLDKITVSSKLLLSLINEVLDMSKIESGHIVLAEEEVNLADLVQGVVTMVQPQISQKGLGFNAFIGKLTNELVVSDMQRLQQLLLNLLSNAVKYTPPGGSVSLEISESPAEAPGRARYAFIIADTGIGMKPSFLSHVFEPFERADDAQIQMAQGTGLGLAICKSIAELMGGTIRVESEYGKGSRFIATVSLKVQEMPVDDGALCGRAVLLADDDETVCRNTCERLRELGLRAEWVTAGEAAVEKAAAAHAAGQDYFAALIDLKMPGMDGKETTRRIRERVGPGLPILIISAYDLSEQMDAAASAGANGFITKPLFRSRLVYKLKQFLGGSAPQEAPAERTCALYPGRRVLLVEDNELNREIAAELLSQLGALVETAQNGQEAVDMVSKAPPSYYELIFMDMQMPVMDGCTAATRIRALPRQDVKTVPIVAMTANAFADDRQKTKEAGMNEHLTKPIDLGQLQQIFERWLP